MQAALLLVAALFTGSAVLAGSGLLIALAVLLLSAALGSETAYGHAFYALGVEQPLVTVLAFSALAAAANAVAQSRVLGLRAAGERLANIAARTALLLVNLGLWVGSLWGDDAVWIRRALGRAIPDDAFSLAWAIALLGAAVWAGRTNRRWVLNLACVFGGIHFYTQWFERLGATPLSLFGGGVLMLAFALGTWRLNERWAGERPATDGSETISRRASP
jgi:iron complex transport system permease protein